MFIEKSIDINNNKMTYYDFNEKNPKVLIFLSGFGVPYPLLDMYNLVNDLKNNFRCIIIDRFGYGKSDVVLGKRTAKKITSEIIEFLIKLKIDPKNVVIVGHSLGSLYALDIALSSKIKGVILIDYEKIGITNDFITKLFYGVYFGMSNIRVLKEKEENKMIDNMVKQVEGPESIKKDAIKCIKEKVPNICIKNELDASFNDYKLVCKKLKNKKINSGILIYTKKNESINNTLSKRFNDVSTILVESNNHFIHYENHLLLANEIIKFMSR